MAGRKSLSAAWRDCIRDSDLDQTAKTIALVLSTYMNGNGQAFPSKETLAHGASVSKRAADTAVSRLEDRGFLTVKRTLGRQSNRYQAALPTVQAATGLTVQADAPLETFNHANENSNHANQTPSTLQVAAPESIESFIKKAEGTNGNCPKCAGNLDEDNYCHTCRHTVMKRSQRTCQD
jgi:hypothetical protein